MTVLLDTHVWWWWITGERRRGEECGVAGAQTHLAPSALRDAIRLLD